MAAENVRNIDVETMFPASAHTYIYNYSRKQIHILLKQSIYST